MAPARGLPRPRRSGSGAAAASGSGSGAAAGSGSGSGAAAASGSGSARGCRGLRLRRGRLGWWRGCGLGLRGRLRRLRWRGRGFLGCGRGRSCLRRLRWRGRGFLGCGRGRSCLRRLRWRGRGFLGCGRGRSCLGRRRGRSRFGRRRSLGCLSCRCLLARSLLGLLPGTLLRFLALALEAGLLLGLLTRAFLGLLPGALFGLLALALETGPLFLLAEDVVTLRHDVADGLRDQRARPDRVIVAGDDVVDPVGIAVGVDEPDDRDAQPLGLAHRDRLGLEVDHEHRVGQALHVLDATEVRAELLEVRLRRHSLARREQLKLPLGLVPLEVVQPLDPLRNRLEVREQAAQPAVVDVGHVGGFRVVADRVACLLLGPDEQHGAAAAGDVRGEHARVLQEHLGLKEVDDVVPVALAEDEAAHLGVPSTCLVAEMDAGLQQLPDSDLSHCCYSLVFLVYIARSRASRGPRISRQGAIRMNGMGDGQTEFTQVLACHIVFRCSGPFASPTFSGGSYAGRTSLPLPPVARFATSGGAAVDGPPRLLFGRWPFLA